MRKIHNGEIAFITARNEKTHSSLTHDETASNNPTSLLDTYNL